MTVNLVTRPPKPSEPEIGTISVFSDGGSKDRGMIIEPTGHAKGELRFLMRGNRMNRLGDDEKSFHLTPENAYNLGKGLMALAAQQAPHLKERTS